MHTGVHNRESGRNAVKGPFECITVRCGGIGGSRGWKMEDGRWTGLPLPTRTRLRLPAAARRSRRFRSWPGRVRDTPPRTFESASTSLHSDLEDVRGRDCSSTPLPLLGSRRARAPRRAAPPCRRPSHRSQARWRDRKASSCAPRPTPRRRRFEEFSRELAAGCPEAIGLN